MNEMKVMAWLAFVSVSLMAVYILVTVFMDVHQYLA